MRVCFCPDKHVSVKIVTPSEDSSKEALDRAVKCQQRKSNSFSISFRLPKITISNLVARIQISNLVDSDTMVFGVSTPGRMSVLTNYMHSVLSWL